MVGITYHCAGDKKPSRFVDLCIEDNHIHHVDRSCVFGSSTHWVRSKWYSSLGVVIRNNVLDDIGGDGIVNVATDSAVVELPVLKMPSQESRIFRLPLPSDPTGAKFRQWSEWRKADFADIPGQSGPQPKRSTI
jgi:hypothetical protein